MYIRVKLYWGYLIVLWLFRLVCILYCGCIKLFYYVWVSVCGGVMVICELVFTVFCIVCTVFCIVSFMYIYSYFFFVCASVRATATEWKFNFNNNNNKLRKHSKDSLQKTAILGTSHIIRKVLQCEAWSLSGGDHCWFKRSTGKKCLWQRHPYRIMMMIIIIMYILLYYV